ncbi:MAG TPA: hypothetical protein VNF45_09755 [Candidatus Binataceae bacterium]|nr:hypothetical protein [Candidatus Binataceae bacterium]
MAKRAKPIRKPSRLLQAALAMAAIALGFSILLARLELTQEGYRLSAVRGDILSLEETNRNLKLQAAELGSHQRLLSLAPKYDLAPPAPGQVVTVP